MQHNNETLTGLDPELPADLRRLVGAMQSEETQVMGHDSDRTATLPLQPAKLREFYTNLMPGYPVPPEAYDPKAGGPDISTFPETLLAIYYILKSPTHPESALRDVKALGYKWRGLTIDQSAALTMGGTEWLSASAKTQDKLRDRLREAEARFSHALLKADYTPRKIHHMLGRHLMGDPEAIPLPAKQSQTGISRALRSRHGAEPRELATVQSWLSKGEAMMRYDADQLESLAGYLISGEAREPESNLLIGLVSAFSEQVAAAERYEPLFKTKMFRAVLKFGSEEADLLRDLVSYDPLQLVGGYRRQTEAMLPAEARVFRARVMRCIRRAMIIPGPDVPDPSGSDPEIV